MTGIEVSLVSGEDLASPLKLLEEVLRDGEPLPGEFVERLRGAVASGELEVLAASAGGRTVGVAVVAYRPSVSAAADFASIEELHVRPGERRQGIGRALLEAVEARISGRGVSYVEVQTDDEAAEFYAAHGYEEDAAHGYEEESGARVLSKSLPIINELKPET
ncbi:MAG: GNAT family N-acetyltransferase [Rubrobacteraceae bacterium]